MLLRKLIIFGVAAGTSASVPILYQSNPDAIMGLLATQSSQVETRAPETAIAVAAKAPASEQGKSSGIAGRKVAIAMGENGHFFGEFKLNGRRIDALVDTGATAVAINVSTARRIGIQLHANDMTQRVNTANGTAKAAVVLIDRLEVGRISVDNVQAVVLEDDALSGTLIGMSFLGRLKSFNVSDQQLLLTQ